MQEDGSIGFEIKSIANLIRRKLDQMFAGEEFDGLTGMQNAMIGYIMDVSAEQEVFQRDVEQEFNIRRSTATGLLQNLERRGYITRVPVASDGRLKKIEVTEKARRVQVCVRREIDRFNRELEQDFTEEERQKMMEFLARVKKNLQ